MEPESTASAADPWAIRPTCAPSIYSGTAALHGSLAFLHHLVAVQLAIYSKIQAPCIETECRPHRDFFDYCSHLRPGLHGFLYLGRYDITVFYF